MSSRLRAGIAKLAAKVESDLGHGSARPRVQSVARAMQMVDLVARSDRGLTAKDISAATGINRSATYHLLHTLTQTGVLGRDGRRYLMGPRAGVFAAGLTRHHAPNERLVTSARTLAATIQEPVAVSAWSAQGVTVLGRTGGVGLAPALIRGFADDSHARASGKLLLALGPREARERYVAAHRFIARTRNTIVDPDVFERELDATRERGYAIDDEEFLPGVCCVAGALDTGRGTVALSIVAPTERFRADRELFVAELTRAAGASGVPALSFA